MRPVRVLSIQSSVAFGHVGNSAAVFPLQRLGLEVLAVSTVMFSNHTGYPGWHGPVLPAADVAAVIRGIDELGELGSCAAVLSGYQGAEDVGAVVLDAVRRVKELNPSAIYLADPVLGDVGRGFYVREGIPGFMRDAVVPAADVSTPNLFELTYLAGFAPDTLAEVVRAADVVRRSGPAVVLVTSVEVADVSTSDIAMVAVSDEGAWVVGTPRLDLAAVSGGGDLTAALFLAALVAGGTVAQALETTAAQVHGVLRATHRSGATELEIVAAQDELLAPTRRFPVEQLR